MSTQLRIGSRLAALAEDETGLAADMAPRPFVHPVLSPGGVALTDMLPEDHIHHLGLSLPLADVDGVHYWGGKTFVPGSGYVVRENHGRQDTVSRTVARLPGGAGSREERDLVWRRPDGSEHLLETRSVSVRSAGDVLVGRDGTAAGRGGALPVWELEWRSRLVAPDGASIGSPATNGRSGAGYGGIFWRFPPWRAQVLCADGPGEARAHGSVSPWLCVACPQESVSVVLVRRGPAAPWFARVAEYLGAGPALAWQDRRELAPGRPLEIGLDAIIVDSVLADQGAVGRLMERLGR